MEHRRLLELADEQTPPGERLRVGGLYVADEETMQIRGNVTAWICENTSAANEDSLSGVDVYWWCPAYGYSISGSKLYEDADDARRELIARLEVKRTNIDQAITTAINQLTARRA